MKTRSQSNEKNIDSNTTNPGSQLPGNPLHAESETLGSPTSSSNTPQPNSGTPFQERIRELFSTPYSNTQAPSRANQNYPSYDSATFRPRIQLRSPEVFSGSQAEYEGFNFSMQNEFRANASYYSNDSDKIAYCSSFLGGAALSYYQSQVPSHPEVQTYWPAFQQVIDFFKPVNQNAVTLSSLRGIHQTTTTRAYAEAFLPLATKLFGSFPDTFLCQQFIYGLPSNISNALLSFPLDSNLQITVERAIAIDDRIRDQNAEIRREELNHKLKQTKTFKKEIKDLQIQFIQKPILRQLLQSTSLRQPLQSTSIRSSSQFHHSILHQPYLAEIQVLFRLKKDSTASITICASFAVLQTISVSIVQETVTAPN